MEIFEKIQWLVNKWLDLSLADKALAGDYLFEIQWIINDKILEIDHLEEELSTFKAKQYLVMKSGVQGRKTEDTIKNEILVATEEMRTAINNEFFVLRNLQRWEKRIDNLNYLIQSVIKQDLRHSG